MNVSPTSSSAPTPQRPAQTPEEAAEQFESVLVRQFVEVMTKDLFDGEGEGMVSGQADLQRDTLTDVLTSHLVEDGAFGIAEMMREQWAARGQTAPEPTDAPPAGGSPERTADGARLEAMTMDEALRQFAPAQGRPVSIDTSSDGPDGTPSDRR
jgi:Rod binding domain-containing protein